MNRNQCGLRLLPLGYWKPQVQCRSPYTCMSPCSSKKGPVNFQDESSFSSACTTAVLVPETSSTEDGQNAEFNVENLGYSTLPPININLIMSKDGAENDGQAYSTSQYPTCPATIPASTTVEPLNICGGTCNICNYDVRKPRCEKVNYVQKACPIIPDRMGYNPLPDLMQSHSVYQEEYITKPTIKTKPFIPRPKYEPAGSLKGDSVYKAAYIPHQVSPYQKPSWSEKDEFKPSEFILNGTTTYKSSFQRLISNPAPLMKPKRQIDLNPEPLDGRTTYSTAFTAYENPDCAKNYAPHTSLQEEHAGPFSGITMYQASYQPPLDPKQVESYKPKQQYYATSDRVDGRTSYQDAYLPFAFQKCVATSKRDCYFGSDWKA